MSGNTLGLSLAALMLLLSACGENPKEIKKSQPHAAGSDVLVMQSPDAAVSVQLVGMVHVAPDTFYETIVAKMKSFAEQQQGEGKTAILHEGIACTSTRFNLQGVVDAMQLPSYLSLVDRFGEDGLRDFKAGKDNPAIVSYFVDFVGNWLKAHDTVALMKQISCQDSTKTETINTGYSDISKKISEENGQKWVFQLDADSSYLQIKDLPKTTLTTIDIDMSDLDLQKPEHLIWNFLMQKSLSFQKSASVWKLMTTVGSRLNVGDLRNGIAIQRLKEEQGKGVKSFILPWGNAHLPGLQRLLAAEGFSVIQSEEVPYADCEAAAEGSLKSKICAAVEND